MKYWKNINNECGIMDDGGYVPFSNEITKTEYDTYVRSQPMVEESFPIIEYENIDTGEILKLKRHKSIANIPLFGAELEEWRINNLS